MGRGRRTRSPRRAAGPRATAAGPALPPVLRRVRRPGPRGGHSAGRGVRGRHARPGRRGAVREARRLGRGAGPRGRRPGRAGRGRLPAQLPRPARPGRRRGRGTSPRGRPAVRRVPAQRRRDPRRAAARHRLARLDRAAGHDPGRAGHAGAGGGPGRVRPGGARAHAPRRVLRLHLDPRPPAALPPDRAAQEGAGAGAAGPGAAGARTGRRGRDRFPSAGPTSAAGCTRCRPPSGRPAAPASAASSTRTWPPAPTPSAPAGPGTSATDCTRCWPAAGCRCSSTPTRRCPSPARSTTPATCRPPRPSPACRRRCAIGTPATTRASFARVQRENRALWLNWFEPAAFYARALHRALEPPGL